MLPARHRILSRWGAVADAGLRQRASAVLECLSRHMVECVRHDNPMLRLPTWTGGGLGLALAAAHLRTLDSGLIPFADMERALQMSLEHLRGERYDGLTRGYVGALVSLVLLRDAGVALRFDEARLRRAAQEALVRRASACDESLFEADLINGAAGISVALDILSRRAPMPQELMSMWTEQLRRQSRARCAVMAGMRTPDELDIRMRRSYGLAHGVAGMLVALSHVAPEVPEVSLLSNAVSAGIREDAYGPYLSLSLEHPERQRAAWCNGLVGFAAAGAGLLLPNIDMRKGVEAIGMRPLVDQMLVQGDGRSRRLDENESLCHGIAGAFVSVAVVASQSPAPELHLLRDELLATLVTWAEERCATFDARRGDSSFLTGISGVACSIGAALEEKQPAWFPLLLLAAPRQEVADEQ